jgi:hypothetical protein
MDAFDVTNAMNIYARGTDSIPQKSIAQKNSSAQVIEPVKSSNQKAYTVTLSSEALNRKNSQFDTRQKNERKTFELNQQIDSEAKDRELEAEKSRFQRRQTAEEHRFIEKQRIEKLRFNEQQRQNT